MMIRKRIMTVLAAFVCFALAVSGCAGEQDNAQNVPTEIQTEAATEAVTEAVVETTVATEPVPVYEKQTVSLCTMQTMKQYDTGAVFKTAYAYDEYGRKIEQWRVMDDGSKSQVSVFIYDEFGNNVEERYEESSRYVMTYDEAGRMLSKLYYYGDVCDMEYYYTYNEDGFVIEDVRITRYATEKIATYQISYNEDYTEAYIDCYENGEKVGYTLETYNAQGQVLTSDNYNLDGSWRSGNKYAYDEQGRITTEWRYSGSQTQASYETIYTYDENGLLVSKNVDYYYGHLIEYTYEPFEILVRVN